MESPELVDLSDQEEKTSLIKVQPEEEHAFPEKSRKPLETVAFNQARLRWALYRVNKNTVSVKDLENGSLWSSASCFVLFVFAGLFVLGFWQLQIKYLRTIYYDALPFHCVCSVVYTVTFLRGIYIFRKPCVFWIVYTWLRLMGNMQNIVFEENEYKDDIIDEEESK